MEKVQQELQSTDDPTLVMVIESCFYAKGYVVCGTILCQRISTFDLVSVRGEGVDCSSSCCVETFAKTLEFAVAGDQIGLFLYNPAIKPTETVIKPGMKVFLVEKYVPPLPRYRVEPFKK